MDRSSKRKMGRLYRGAFLLGLALIGISSTAFGAFVTTNGGDGINVNPGEVTVAGIFNPSDYFFNNSVSASSFCDQGFVDDGKLVYSGSITYSFYLRSTYGGVSLSSYFPSTFDLTLTLTVSHSSGNISDYFTIGLGTSTRLGSPTLSSSGSSYEISCPGIATPTSTTSYSVTLTITTASSYSSVSTFPTAASFLNSTTWTIDSAMR